MVVFLRAFTADPQWRPDGRLSTPKTADFELQHPRADRVLVFRPRDDTGLQLARSSLESEVPPRVQSLTSRPQR